MLKNKKLYRIFSRKSDDKWDSRKVLNTLDSWVYHQAITSSRKRYNFCSMWQTIKDDILCGSNREDISRSVG